MAADVVAEAVLEDGLAEAAGALIRLEHFTVVVKVALEGEAGDASTKNSNIHF